MSTINTPCGMIATHIYTELKVSPESINSDHVKRAMDDLCFDGYTKSKFIDGWAIRQQLFDSIVEYAWQLDDATLDQTG